MGAIPLLSALFSRLFGNMGCESGEGFPRWLSGVGGVLLYDGAVGDGRRQQLLCLCSFQEGEAGFMAALCLESRFPVGRNNPDYRDLLCFV